jgi:hypothetical protein
MFLVKALPFLYVIKRSLFFLWQSFITFNCCCATHGVLMWVALVQEVMGHEVAANSLKVKWWLYYNWECLPQEQWPVNRWAVLPSSGIVSIGKCVGALVNSSVTPPVVCSFISFIDVGPWASAISVLVFVLFLMCLYCIHNVENSTALWDKNNLQWVLGFRSSYHYRCVLAQWGKTVHFY